ncbi:MULTISPECIES: hypothetical protein [Nocardia]|uniref:hypothetical protein n=1 Tax=Nocardia nova TaxID=37330 RepID=UPI0025B1683E|nr:hypothetical protein [Nocardia nova]MDN2497461.1 hypothetical protein [Nocardia nova]
MGTSVGAAGGINIGTYNPGADSHLTYRATITATAPATLVNRVYTETGNGWTETSTIIYVQ